MKLQPPVISPLLGPDTFLSTLFRNALNLCSSRNVTDKVSRPFKTEGKNIVWYSFSLLSLFSKKKRRLVRSSR
jgi:hypothetical protein